MKHVTINKFHKQNKNYVVYLGNGTCHNFKQERQATQFLATTSKFLTKNLYELRMSFNQITVQYNSDWAYFFHDKKTMSSKKSMDDAFCKETLRAIQDTFDIIIERCEFTNGNYFAFQKSIHIVKELKRVVLQLDKLHKSKSNAAERYEFDTYYENLDRLENKVQNYSEREAFDLFRMPIHLDKLKDEFLPVLNRVA
jgi:hypothetical protein